MAGRRIPQSFVQLGVLILVVVAAVLGTAALVNKTTDAFKESQIEATQRLHQQTLAGCYRGNVIRTEINTRTQQTAHIAKDLNDLATALSVTRQQEALIFGGIAIKYNFAPLLAPLEKRYQQAASIDAHIADEAAHITLPNLPLLNCAKAYSSPTGG